MSTPEQVAFYDTLRVLQRNKRIHPRDARRFAYEASVNARQAAKDETRSKGGETK